MQLQRGHPIQFIRSQCELNSILVNKSQMLSTKSRQIIWYSMPLHMCPLVINRLSGDARVAALFHFSSCTDSNKSSLQFLCNFVVLNASEGSLFSRYLYITTAGVKWSVAAV
jgi:hypothetical protein